MSTHSPGRRILSAAIALVACMVAAAALVGSAPAAAAAQTGPHMTNFDPQRHGFKFRNDFQTAPLQLPGLQDLRWGGLCGGMVYAALDYFNRAATIPQQSFLPATGSPLFNHIYNRQINSLTSNADKWTELGFNPFGWRTTEFFNWGLQGWGGGRLQELRQEIDAGRPAPLGLFKAGNGGFGPHHQVLAIGYDMGRYKGDLGAFKEELKIFVYDPNHPGRVMALVPSPSTNSYHYAESSNEQWMTYFVDRKYQASVPPVIQTTSGMVRELVLEIRTGADDLHGGNDNVDLTINYNNSSPQVVRNINRGARWIDNYTQWVTVPINPVVTVEDIDNIVLKTTFGGGLSGDNWNVDLLRIWVQGRSVYYAEGRPLVRFNGLNLPYVARIGNLLLDGGFEAQENWTVSPPWSTEGPDLKGIENGVQARTGVRNAFVQTSRSTQWNSFVQRIPVTPNTNYVLRGFVRTSGNVNTAFMGVRPGNSNAPQDERHFGPSPAGLYQQVEVPFNSRNNTTMTVFVGYWGVEFSTTFQVDALTVRQA